MRKVLAVITLLALAAFSLGARDYVLSSPDGTLKIKVSDGSKLVWSITKGGATVMEPSEIALDVKGHGRLGPNAKVSKLSRRPIDEMLTAVVPTKYREVRDRCNEMTLRMKGGWSVIFRAYDNGAAYRFATEFDDSVEVLNETSEWCNSKVSKLEVCAFNNTAQHIKSIKVSRFIILYLGDFCKFPVYRFYLWR